jgi:ArsR family transcriptional regulator
MKEIFKLQAEVCKTMANPKRLEIIYALKKGERSAGELVGELGLPKANVSQHLSVLKSCGVVRARRKGVNIYYAIANPKIIRACELMKDVLIEEVMKRQALLKGFKTGRGG